MIRLINGDCYEELPKLEVNVDLIVTDPPYQFGSVRGSGIFSEKMVSNKKDLLQVVD